MRSLTSIGGLVAAALLCFPGAWAQRPPKDSQSSGPVTPIQPLSPLTGGSDGSNQAIADNVSLTQSGAAPGASAQAQPDTHVLSSAETLGVGSLRGLRHMFDPALQFSEFYETGLVAGRATVVSNLGGSLDLDEHWGPYHLAASYNGTEAFYQPSYSGMHFVPYQGLSVSPEILLRRWTLRLRDSALYSWGAGLGGLFTGGPAQAAENSSLNTIQPSLLPNGPIQTGPARELNNIVLAEADYASSRRTTLTFLASDGLVHFLAPGYIDSQSLHGRVGYNYAVSAANSISLSYDYNRTSFGGASNRLQTDQVQMGFGRKITGRLALQLEAGPQLLRLADFGSSGSRQPSWTAFGAVTYNLPRSGYYLSYTHGVTPGSGVFFGSKNDTVTGMATREFTQFWSASVNGGYAINKNLVPAGNFVSRFDTWFAGANLNRQLGRQVRLSLSYGFQRQSSGGGVCPVLSCGLPGSISFRQFGATLQWHPLTVRSR
jgi:hypothetical protein